MGRRYRRLEEIGAPFALTIDNQTMKDDTVTLRYRDSMMQERLGVSEIPEFLDARIDSK
ncbi:MAG TPA: His/Gly/Thr/Pro-type tRNA ligase C-terminal domain-containing protein [Nitrososphaeraceae archaeon]|nr:His/Gly/Thr/Pro-type tRNA ligase C-terminal domain-containing protein [Nitrososphaeraceae archaeon]